MKRARLCANRPALLYIGVVADSLKHTAFDLLMGKRCNYICKRTACAAGMLACYNKRTFAQTQRRTVVCTAPRPKRIFVGK